MKKNVIYLMALVFAISCVKEIPQEITPEPEQETIGSIVFSAEVENDDVKTTLGADELGKLPLWNSGDEIAIFMGDETGYKFRTEDEGVKKANFQGPINAAEPVGGNDFDANIGVYPFSIAGGITPKSNGQFDVAVTLPANQSYTANSFGSGAFPMVAVTESKADASLKFKNLCGMLKLQIKGDNIPVRYISIKGNNHEKLCGEAVVSAENGKNPSVTFSDSAQEEVVLDCGKTGVRLNLTDSTAFYLVLPPVTFTGGVTIKIVTTHNTIIEKTTTASIQIKRSSIKSIKAFTIENVVPDYLDSGKGIPVLGDWDDDPKIPNTILYWAPVNCGYEESVEVNTDSDHRLGKLYQWGAGDSNLYDGKALSLYYGDDIPSPWYDVINGTKSDKWNNNQGPCPDGWRLPTSKEFSVLCAGKNGDYGWVSAGTYAGQSNIYPGAEFFGANADKTAGTGVFFPAAGFRRSVDGSAYDRGTGGYYWSSTPYPYLSYRAYYLDFKSSGLYPRIYYDRADAFSVRCVSGDGDPAGETPQPAVLTSVAVSEITTQSALCGASVITEGDATVTERGVCYSTSSAPTVADSKVVATGSGIGSFTCKLTGLTESTTYYVRAYAVNACGTYYGDVQSLTTRVPDYVENRVNHGRGTAVIGDWDGDGNQTTLYWAPVNCGYEESGTVNSNNDHRLGKLYQWGAGDARLYDGKACSLYYDTATPSPWYGNKTIVGTTSDKWNNNQGPCPEGWRLPTSKEFQVLCAGKNGNYGWVSAGTYAGQSNKYPGAEFFGANADKTAGTGVFFPAAGCRRYSNGSAISRVIFCDYWSSTPYPSDSDFACGLGVGYDYFGPQYYDYRAYAFSVRCVTE